MGISKNHFHNEKNIKEAVLSYVEPKGSILKLVFRVSLL